MTPMADRMNGEALAADGGAALNARLLRVMATSIAAAALVSMTLMSWRTTTGLLLGGALSLLNFRWLHTSVGAIFALNRDEGRVQTRGSRYLLRYLVIGIAVFTAYQLRLVSLPATIVGLCSFVPALMFEAAWQFYLVIRHREDSY